MKNYSRMTRKELVAEIEALHRLVSKQRFDIEKLRSDEALVWNLKVEYQRLKNEYQYMLAHGFPPKIKNERGAGRKSKVTDELKAEVRAKRREGMTFKKIAESMKVSVGLVHKAYHMPD